MSTSPLPFITGIPLIIGVRKERLTISGQLDFHRILISGFHNIKVMLPGKHNISTIRRKGHPFIFLFFLYRIFLYQFVSINIIFIIELLYFKLERFLVLLEFQIFYGQLPVIIRFCSQFRQLFGQVFILKQISFLSFSRIYKIIFCSLPGFIRIPKLITVF